MEMVVAEELFAGGGEMETLMRSLDWSQTLLGSVSEWAQSLKTAVSIILTSRYPMFIWWGAEYANLYNDAYRPILGASKHPQFLGQSAKDCWADIWDVVGPLADSVLTTGQPTWSEDLLLLMDRNAYLEETYFTFSYSPVRDESGGVGGVFCAVTETTGRIIGERRLRTLRELAAKTAEAKTVEEAYHIATTTLSINPYDIPFALLYRIEADGKQARLAGKTGIEAGTVASPQQVDLSQESEADRWNLAKVNRTGQAELVSDLPTRFGVLPKGAWSEEPTKALVIPITQSGKAQLAGLLVVGISPRREFDDDYQGFFDLIASNVATAIANADAYEAERKRAAALAELDRAKTIFFSNISHEFRTPLTLMLGSLEETLAGNEPLSTHQREQLEVAQRNSLRLLKLVNSLLDFSRIEAGRIQAVYEPTDLATFTRELASVFRSAIERAGMQLVVDCPPLPEEIYVDREMWEKIVLNLLSNAFKFTFEGKITVALRWCTDHVELDVSDTGIGIPENELPRLFERFHRVPGVRGRTYEGSGIGLSLVQELVRLHSGTLSVVSVERQGSCFTVSIPAGFIHLPQNQIGATRTLTSTATQPAAYVEEALRWLPAESGSVEFALRAAPLTVLSSELNPELPIQNSKFKTQNSYILLVDDNADIRDYVGRLLSRDYEVEAVSDGLAALDAVQRHFPDLVLTDVMMPGLDGLGLLRSLRNNPVTQSIPIILLSARAGEESRIEGLEAGADDYLIKPFSARELLARVRTNLELAQLRREAVRSEIALRRSEEQLRVAQQAAGAGLWNWDIVADRITWSEDYYQLYGLNPATTASYENWIASIWEPDRERADRAAREALERQTNLNVEFRVFHPIQGLRWLVALGQTFYDANGQPIRMTGIALDISDRKQAEVALCQREEQARLAIKVGRLGTWRYNLHTELVELDKRMREIWGEPDDASTIPLPRVMERIHPDDRERVATTISAVLDPGSSGTYEIDYRIVWDDGTQRWVSANGQVQFEGEGDSRQPVGFFGTALDISEQKRTEDELRRSEQRLQLAQQAGRIGTWEWNLLTNDVSWSDGIWKLLGIELGSITPKLESFVKFLHPDEKELILQRVEIALAQGDDYYDEFRVIRQDGTIGWLLSKGQVIRTQDGQPERFLGINVDITARKQAEEALRQSEERLRLAMEGAQMGTWDVDLSTGKAIWSNQHFTMLGYEPTPTGKASEAIWYNRIHPEDRERVAQEWQQSRQEHRLYRAEYRVVRADTQQIAWLAALGSFVYNPNGEAVRSIGVLFDITDRKLAEVALRESEFRFRNIADHSPIMIWMSAPDGAGVWFNQQWCKFTGQTLLEALGSGWVAAIHPEDAQSIETTCLQAHQRHEPVRLEYRLRRQDGEYRWVFDSAVARFDDTGVYLGYIGSIIDITERKQAEAELQHTFQTLSTLINASPLPIVVIKPNMTVQLWNPAAEQLFGWSEAEVLGQPIPIVPEEKRDECCQVREAVAKGEVFAGVETYRCKRDAAMVIVSISAAPLSDEQGNLNAILLIFQDITQRQQAQQALRQSEERYRCLAESIPQLVWTANAEGVLLDVNQRWLDYTGLTLAQAQIEGWQAIVHPDDVAIVSQHWASAQQHDTYYQAEGRMRRVDGVYRWYLHQAVPLKNERGEVIKWFGTATDIDDQKQLEQQRDRILQREQAAREEAERANRIKDEFLAVLSHELRSPLNPILGWSKLLQSRTLDEQKTKHALATIERNALLQTQLIEDLLDVSRILRGKLVLNAVPVNLASTIEAALETVRLAVEAKSIQIQRVLSSNVGQVMGESARLQQVIWNLLSNAVKFTPSGGTIEIRLEQINTYAQLQVKDTGKGINPEFLPHVFEYFRQEDGTTTRKFGGLGLGLAIVRHLIELHGGSVWVESLGEGLGATFTVRLPLIPIPTQTPQDNTPATSVTHLSGLRILVVDDQPDIRDIVAFILEQAGATVRVAASAPEVLNLMAESLPDVLICDIGMPDIDGYMLMRQIRALPAEQGGKIPAIALTAYAGEYDQKQALAAGFQQHIAKPVEPEELVRAIAHLVQHPRSI